MSGCLLPPTRRTAWGGVRRAVTLARWGLTAALVVAAGLLVLRAAPAPGTAVPRTPTPGPAPVGPVGPAGQAGQEEQAGLCARHGLDPRTAPASALVREPGGRVVVVGFARGWAVWQGEAPGTVVAMCVGHPPS